MTEKRDNFKGKRGSNSFAHRRGDAAKYGGRKKNKVNLGKDLGYSKDDVRKTFAWLAGCTIGKLKQIMDDPDSTALNLLAASAYLKAIKSGEYSKVRDIIELFADKAKQSIETKIDATVKGAFHDWTDEQIDTEIKRLLTNDKEN